MSVSKRILLVDDDESLRDALAEQLTLHEEFEVIVSGTGQEALERAKEETFDMVLLDVGSPTLMAERFVGCCVGPTSMYQSSC